MFLKYLYSHYVYLKNKLYIFYKKVIHKIILVFRRADRFFYFSFKNWVPKIHINDRFERMVKWVIRTATVIGVLSSVFAFSEWYLNLGLALLLLIIGQLLEKAIFVFFTFYIAAIPEYDASDWSGMAWVLSVDPNESHFEVGIIFSSREAAQRIFPVIKHWCKTGDIDNTNLIQISVVVNENSNEYHVYIFQNTEKDPDYVQWKKKMDDSQPTKEHRSNIMQIMLCKGFKYSSSFFPKFSERYRNGDSFDFVAYIIEGGRPVLLENLGVIRKKELKIISVINLTKKDREYEHYRFVVDLPEDRGLEPPPTTEFSF